MGGYSTTPTVLVTGTRLDDDSTLDLGTSSDFNLVWETADADANYMNFVIGVSRNLVFSEDANVDWTHATSTNPTIFVQSADSGTVADFTSISHDQTDGVISTGAGNLNLTPTGATVAVTGTVTASTPIVVGSGGTGVSTLADGGILFGSGSGAISASAVLGVGEGLVGDNATDPQNVPLLMPGETLNLGITLSSGVFTITDIGGAALSSSNLGFIGVPSTTAGQSVVIGIDAAVQVITWTDEAGTETYANNMGFGVTTTVDWAQDVPFFLYFVNEDNTAANSGFFFTRDPTMGVTPAAGLIHDTDALGGTADSQNHIAGMWADDSGKAAKPCALIGAFRMRYDTTNDGWTVQAFGDNDGIGPDCLRKTFGTTWVFPVQQNGADSLYHLSSAGTAPTWATAANIDYEYKVTAEGMVWVEFSTRDAGNCTDGTGGETVFLHLPSAVLNASGTGNRYIIGHYSANDAATADGILAGDTVGGGTDSLLLQDSVFANLINTDFGDPGDDLSAAFWYRTF